MILIWFSTSWTGSRITVLNENNELWQQVLIKRAFCALKFLLLSLFSSKFLYECVFKEGGDGLTEIRIYPPWQYEISTDYYWPYSDCIVMWMLFPGYVYAYDSKITPGNNGSFHKGLSSLNNVALQCVVWVWSAEMRLRMCQFTIN